MNVAATVQEHKLTITCSACGQEWADQHRCPVPPPIGYRRYTTGALSQLAEHLALVLEDRAKE